MESTFVCRAALASRPLWRALSLLVFCVCAVHAAQYRVAADGSGDFTTIQACADVAQAGDTCLVSAGTYSEHVVTKRSGTGDGQRILFMASGSVSMQGFTITNAYVTVNGFTFTGLTGGAYGLVQIGVGGDYCQILNNTFGPNAARIKGIQFAVTNGASGNHSHISGNTFLSLGYNYIEMHGNGHLVDYNYLQDQNGNDFIDLWGVASTFRRNVFWRGNPLSGNHPDFVQIWGVAGEVSYGHLFEENMIIDLANSQFCQINAGSPLISPTAYPGYGNITFRRNIIAGIHDNANFGLPGMIFENNTTYRLAYNSSGLAINSSITRGTASSLTIKNNAFLAGGNTPSTNPGISGFYGYGGSNLTTEVVWDYITQNPAHTYGATEQGIYADLQSHGYINSNGLVQSAAFTLAAMTNDTSCDSNALSQFFFSDMYLNYKQRACDAVIETATAQTNLLATFYADYNYVGGLPAANYPPKKSSSCPRPKTSGSLVTYNFCEPHGVNGGYPNLTGGVDFMAGILAVLNITNATWTSSSKTLTKIGAFGGYTVAPTDTILITSNSSPASSGVYTVAFKTNSDSIVLGSLLSGVGILTDRTDVQANPLNPESLILGPDGIPFTLDDGLKPLPGSPLCGAGEGGTDIGAYSCDPRRVFPVSGRRPPPTNPNMALE